MTVLQAIVAAGIGQADTLELHVRVVRQKEGVVAKTTLQNLLKGAQAGNIQSGDVVSVKDVSAILQQENDTQVQIDRLNEKLANPQNYGPTAPTPDSVHAELDQTKKHLDDLRQQETQP